MNDLIALLSNIDHKFRTLVSKHKDLNIKHNALLAKSKEQVQIIEIQQNKIIELENKINVLSISSGIGSKKDSTNAKLAINELLREIDKCISLLDK